MRLVPVVDNASELARTDNEAFAMLRRQGFGASDSSILLGVNPFPDNTIENLIEEKKSKVVTARELAISNMVNVRKGSDLEPLILQKFEERFNAKVLKPSAMYKLLDTPLTVNFDGVMEHGGMKLPVECKFISTYGGKYWDMTKGNVNNLLAVYDLQPLGDEVNNIYLTKRAAEAGVPIYYYTQIQQQMLALGAPFGYVAGLFDKDWELKVFMIMADTKVQEKLIEEAKRIWDLITN